MTTTLTKRTLAARLARLEKKLNIYDDQNDDEEEECVVEEKEEEKSSGGKGREEEKRRGLLDVLESHVSGFSADGLEYVWFDTSMPKWARVIVGTTFLTGFGLMFWLISQTVSDYQSHPFATSLMYEERANARWPAIIFCPKHPELSMGKMDKIEEDGLDPYSKKANETFMKSMVRKCDFFGVKCDGSGEENITQYWAVKDLGERYGICLEFNHLDKVNKVYCPEDENGETHPTECMFGLYGNAYGLNVFLDPLLEYNSEDPDDPYTNATSLYDVEHFDKRYNGMYVEIHGTTHEAVPAFNSISGAVGQATFISMSERETRRLGKPYHEKECIKDPLYSRSTCISNCQEDIHDKCQYNTSISLYDNLHGNTSKYHTCYNEEMTSEICQCDEPCLSDDFIPIVSTTDVYNASTIEGLKPSTDLNDYANFHVYYNTINLEIIEEVPVYNFYVFIGVIFGHIGFFTGFNLITIVQIGVMFLHLFKRLVGMKF